jgi:transcriptional regulator with XRE-family HTH domain
MNKSVRPWDQPGYSDIESAATRDGEIEVRFANGDVVVVPADTLGVSELGFSIEPGELGTSLNIRTVDGRRREIDWLVIRAAADEDFAEELRARDADESRRLGRRLKALREDRGLTQSSIAQLVRMPPSQLSKLERGETDMRLSTIRSLLRAMGAEFADIAGPHAPEVSAKELRKRAIKAGVPRQLIDRMVKVLNRAQLLPALSRAFQWSREELLAGQPTTPPLTIPVQFKRSTAAEQLASPLLQLAFTFSAIGASATDRPFRELPSDPLDLRSQVLEEYGELTLSTLARWAWDSGVVVLPLVGPGEFAAASWFVDGRPAIVLKDSRAQWIFWLFDLAHELAHIALGHLRNEAVVDVDSPWKGGGDEEEQAANEYAIHLLIGDSQRLLDEVRQRSGETQTEQRHRFKFRVADVAAEAGVSPAVLGVIAAFALEEVARPQDRWGSAQNLGKEEERASGHELVQREFRARVDLDRLSDLDAAIMKAVALK